MAKDINIVYEKYYRTINMSFNELRDWSKNPLSKKASLSREPIKRNLYLLSLKKSEWGDNEVQMANRTISFISRMRKVSRGKPVNNNTMLSKRDISLLNWAYNPYK